VSVLVAHPGGQHWLRLAESLASAGLLSRFITTIALTTDPPAWLPERIRSPLRTRSSRFLSREQLLLSPRLALEYFIARRTLGEGWALTVLERFDKWVALRLPSETARVIVAAENSSLETFREAKRRGLRCVLEAASVHYSLQRQSAGLSQPALSRRIEKRKQEEIELADIVITLSSSARASYADAGVPDSKLRVLHLGVDIDRFKPIDQRLSHRRFTYLFVGVVSRAKGVDLLLDAFKVLNIPGKILRIVGSGPVQDQPPISLRNQVQFEGFVPHSKLSQEYLTSDVLVLPSRFDGFGMVVTEAMACGLPVIVSSAVGAADLVEHGRNGWIFQSENSQQLAEMMTVAWQQQNRFPEIKAAARATACQNSWAAYSQRVGLLYKSLVSE